MKITHIISGIVLGLSLSADAQNVRLSDTQATAETKALFSGLAKIEGKSYLVGHQDALAYGVKWKYVPGRSDVKDLTGDFPALYGWELGHIENNSPVNLDSVPFDRMKGFIRDAYTRGAAITISWHGDNPMNGKSAWDAAPGTVASILPRGDKHQVFVDQLDKVAAFLGSLKGPQGESIPLLYRPFHELSGNWFWWGTKSSSPEDFKTIFRFTVDYLRNKKQLHNLVIVYNTSDNFKNQKEFLDRYPGDEYVDVVSFDTYQKSEPGKDKDFGKRLSTHLSILEKIAKQKNKVAAVAEMGFNQVPETKWFTKTIQPALKGHKFAYMLLWRNAGYKAKENEMEYYVPYPGHATAEDFIKFYQAPETLFESEVRDLNLYK